MKNEKYREANLFKNFPERLRPLSWRRQTLLAGRLAFLCSMTSLYENTFSINLAWTKVHLWGKRQAVSLIKTNIKRKHYIQLKIQEVNLLNHFFILRFNATLYARAPPAGWRSIISCPFCQLQLYYKMKYIFNFLSFICIFWIL